MKTIVLSALLLACAARAQADPAAAPETDMEPRFYGWQILIADGATIGLTFAVKNPAPLLLLALTGPIVHFAHGRAAAGVGSMLARVGLPIIAFAVASANCETDPDAFLDFHCLGRGVAGAFVGYLVSVGIDMVIGQEQVAVPRRALAPVVQLDGDRAVFGVGGTF